MWQAIVNRQEGFLNFTPQNHRAFKQTRVAVFGAGGNGVVMENLLRIGFERFEILDPDVVEETNLNRLPFTRQDLRRPKVDAWRDFLMGVNPGCTVRVHRHKLSFRDAGLVEEIIDRADLVFLQTTSAEANLVIARICARKGRRMLVGTGSSGAWIVSTFMHDDGVTLESIAGFGTENTPLEAIDYKALLPKYLKLTFYPGRKAQYIAAYRDRMLRGTLKARSCKIFVSLVNAAMAWEAAKHAIDLAGLPLEGTRIVKMPVIQVFDPFKGAAYYYNLREGRIGIPDWLTGDITWHTHSE